MAIGPIRKIYIIGEISWESYERFSRKLTELENLDDVPVEVELASDGGDAHAALAFSSRMRLSPCYITVNAVGNVASAAVLILASGDSRTIASETWVMVHEDQATMEGSVSNVSIETRQLRKLENQWAILLSEKTTTSATEWRKLHKATTYLSSEQCLELGLVDKIL